MNEERGTFIYRHSVVVRLTHWVGAICVATLLASGMQVFNAHPALYFGAASDFSHPVFSIDAERRGAERRGDEEIGVTRIFGHAFNTTGALGINGPSNEEQRAFPAWATLPSYQDLATGRRWHLFFAWLLVFDGLIYLIYSAASGHAWRDLIPSASQLRHVEASILDHIQLRFPRGEEARRYNVVQQLTYIAVLFVVVPLLIATGLTMSPGLDAAFPFLTDVLGGRQSARTIHFICAFLISSFAVVHVTMVVLSGVWNNLRSMMTGWYELKPPARRDAEAD